MVQWTNGPSTKPGGPQDLLGRRKELIPTRMTQFSNSTSALTSALASLLLNKMLYYTSQISHFLYSPLELEGY